MHTQATLRRRKWQAGKAGSQPRFCVALFTVGAHIAIAARHDADNAIWIVVEQKRFAENGMETLIDSPEDLKATIVADRKKWADVIQSAGIRAD